MVLYDSPCAAEQLTPDTVDRLIALLNDKSGVVRDYSAAALGQIGARAAKALPLLKRNLAAAIKSEKGKPIAGLPGSALIQEAIYRISRRARPPSGSSCALSPHAERLASPALPDGCEWSLLEFQAVDLLAPKLSCQTREGYRLAAKAHATEVLYALGFADQYGDPAHGARAARRYRAAARRGDVRAMTGLADLYLTGLGVHRDRAQAMRWLRGAIHRGEPGAIFRLGGMKLTGDGVKRDPAEGLRLLRLAARKGYPSESSLSAAPVLSSITNRPERVGQCFSTRVSKVTGRLGDGPGSGSAIMLADGHYNVDYEQLPGIDRSRRGDRVRLCIVYRPDDCPPNDTRGFMFWGLNLRTGRSWIASDEEHQCGGA